MDRGIERRIVLLGGGFLGDRDARLDEYVLANVESDCPRVCFLPTAGGDARQDIERFYAAFEGSHCVPGHLSLFHDIPDDIAAVVAAHDVFYVGGGSTANLLVVWRLHGLDRLLAEAYRRGAMLCGISAGAACWFDGCVTDSFGPMRELHDGLGLLPGSFCPHFDSEPDRAPLYTRAVATGSLPGGWALDDGAAVLFRDEQPVDVVATTAESSLLRVRPVEGGVEMERYEPRLLEGSGRAG
ncbi:Type 1 glutamine amidotransferase-like domain-containing protein [Nocardia pseudobrasiliensis]|uniref:Peptidase E n=1 Tax=Nocardia pseudobrasiliensis TaxID=45979 RepID=A0A370I3V9_9NOCA|nr:peptidase E [Nocardia pseudobrasiliensis]RDI64004.1 peptidase E [Nocardia pseudobrasiliensis]